MVNKSFNMRLWNVTFHKTRASSTYFSKFIRPLIAPMPYMCSNPLRSGRDLVEIRSRFSREMVEIWSRFGRDLVEICSRFGRDLIDIWSKFGRDSVNQYWPRNVEKCRGSSSQDTLINDRLSELDSVRQFFCYLTTMSLLLYVIICLKLYFHLF